MATTATRPGTRAQTRFVRMSATKARVVLNLIRGKQVGEAAEILAFTQRLASEPIEKCLRSAVANAEHNEDIAADELFISACFADEGPTLKRFRPRARGRAGRIHKQTCHITIEVSRLTEDELDELRRRSELKAEGGRPSRRARGDGGDRARRVAKSRAAAEQVDAEETDEVTETEDVTADAVEAAQTAEAAETETAEAAETEDTETGTAEAAETETAEAAETEDIETETAETEDDEPEAGATNRTEADNAATTEEGAADEVATDEGSGDDAGAKQ